MNSHKRALAIHKRINKLEKRSVLTVGVGAAGGVEVARGMKGLISAVYALRGGAPNPPCRAEGIGLEDGGLPALLATMETPEVPAPASSDHSH